MSWWVLRCSAVPHACAKSPAVLTILSACATGPVVLQASVVSFAVLNDIARIHHSSDNTERYLMHASWIGLYLAVLHSYVVGLAVLVGSSSVHRWSGDIQWYSICGFVGTQQYSKRMM